nr:unnamed protein product [Spirometra erinaceieuropaei]
MASDEQGRQSLGPVVSELPAQQGAASQQVPTMHVPQSRRTVQPCSSGCRRPSNGFTYVLICVDRYTRWAEAIPLPNVEAEIIVKAFVSRWVAMFGAPSTVTTDRGAQFESAPFQTLLNFLGCTRIRTTAFHPAANGMVERFH